MTMPVLPPAVMVPDETQPTPTGAQDRAETAEPPAFGVQPEAGPLLTADEAEAARLAWEMWASQDAVLDEYLAECTIAEWRRDGYANVMVMKDRDTKQFRAWRLPTSSPDVTPAMNVAAQLCRRFVSLLMADPPAPLIEPPSGDEEDVAAAEFSRRVLEDLQGDAHLATAAKLREALDAASDGGSGFVFYYTDPRWTLQPLQVMASPEATHASEAVDRGGVPLPEPYEPRYVAPDGSFTDDPTQAAVTWVPALRSKVLRSRRVRMHPFGARVEDARVVQVLDYLTVSELRALFPDTIGDLEDGALEALVGYRPDNWRLTVTDEERRTYSREQKRLADRWVAVLWTYCRAGHDYPQGAMHVAVGKDLTAARGEWGVEDSPARDTLLLPVVQVRQFGQGKATGYGTGLMKLLGPGQELLAAQVAFILDFEEQVRNRKTFLPTTSTLTPEQLRLGRTILPINPGGEPAYEDVPSVPREVFEFLPAVQTAMTDASGLSEAAQAMDAPNVTSGRQLYGIVTQVHAGLSEVRQNVARAYVRCCQIELQQTRRLVTMPRLLRWSGDDRGVRTQAWIGADLTDSTDIRVKPGTLTMLAPTQKAQMLDALMDRGILDREEYRVTTVNLLGGTIGLEDDPFRLRVRAQVEAWKDGPPELEAGTPEAAPPPPPPMVDPMTGALVPAPVAPHPAAVAIFAPSPADTLPNVAAMRLFELARCASSSKYHDLPESWRLALDQEIQRMQAALAPAPALPAGAAPAPAGPGGEFGPPPTATPPVPMDNPNL